jgi:cobalt/nickel transport protein
MKKYPIAILLISGVLAGGVSYFASSNPDGLNKVAIDLGFAENETDHSNGDSALAGYETAGVDNSALSRAIAGITGVFATGLVGSGLYFYVRKPKQDV